MVAPDLPDTAADPRTRLPRDLTPDRYRLELAPDLATATFRGSVDIECTVQERTDTVVCNAAELEVSAAWVEVDGRRLDAAVTHDVEFEQLRLDLPETLATGEVTVHVDFTGVLNDKLRGFYRSTFEDGGATRTIAVTQFEATDARRAFPCWDEPSFKARFAVSLRVADDLVALSNGPELSRTPMGDGTDLVTFGETMPMSTYIVAFVVGPLEITGPVEADGIPIRIVHRPGQSHLARFALDVGAFALSWLADYYGIVYPGEKLDMVAVPDFAFGAMENLGCVIYRDALLLIDPDTASQAELQNVVDVIAHELAHMWFGDLVTMSWWNGIWLNEAFATFMEMKCTAAFRPEWERWQFFGRERTAAFDTDALATTRPIEFHVETPEDAEAMFDVLTYQKGSAVVRMLEQHIGERAFRDGIRRYLQTHQFGNTETSDLWDALEAETGEPVRAMMDSWIFRGGFPLVRIDASSGTPVATQSTFRYLDADAPDEDPWHIPLGLRNESGVTRHLLDTQQAPLPPVPDLLTANAGGHGFFRVAYDEHTGDSIVDRLDDLDPLERYAALDDAFALTLRGTVPATSVLRTIQRLRDVGETDLAIWQLALGALDTFGRALRSAGTDVSAWDDVVVATLGPVAERVDAIDGAQVTDRIRALRGVLLGALGRAGEPAAVARARGVVQDAMADPRAVDGDLAAGALASFARHADAADLDAMLARFRDGDTPQEQLRFLYGAAGVGDARLFDRYLEFLATDAVRSQNLAFAYRAALLNPRHGPVAWDAVERHWEDIEAKLPFNAMQRLAQGVVAMTDGDLAERIAAFLGSRPAVQDAKPVQQSIERMRVSVAFAAREADRLVAALG